ncbi:NADH-ubiquinone oxidoreductase chain 5 [Golovinomyces cichoracearum]|uniref:NADH-ubiquinone oxidoreductase chain 5 n=1 Tax=Golovinomyces cichoracearum TaxID=62708 RepID=A0A420JCG5_9PEZI|nr:NADH-ubiquinone oxidoreductase chain 5 [Golovinomyces cichoracearum]
MLDTEFAVPTLFKLLPFVFTVSLSIISVLFSEFVPKLLINFKFSRFGYNIFSFFNQRFYIELFYNKYIVEGVLKLGGQTTKSLDKGSVEFLGPYGLEKGLVSLSNSLGRLSTVYFSYNDNNLFILVIFTLFALLNNNLSSTK